MNGRTLAGVVTAAVAAAIVAGLMAHGSPAAARERRFDERRVEDLQEIADAIDERYAATGALPQSLDDVVAPRISPEGRRDPSTQHPYEYVIRAADQYDLCAVFSQPSTGRHWPHDAGRSCYTRRSVPHRP